MGKCTMTEYNEISKNCFYRINKKCSYWADDTQCHFLSCPIFSSASSTKVKSAIKKQVSDSVKFSVSDFDKADTSAYDLMKEVRSNDLKYHKDQIPVKKATMVEKKVERMICIVCGKAITDDKYSTIRDPSNTLIYIHSKGKCKPRKDGVFKVREEWLETHTSNEI